MSDDDGDNVVLIGLVDGGVGDDDGIANGVIVDQGGPGYPAGALGGTLMALWHFRPPILALWEP